MKIKKLGHCCMVLEVNGKRIMTDPSNSQYGGDSVSETGLSAILITHEHGDHLHIETLKEVLKNNPEAIVISNTSVRKLLTEEGIPFIKVEDGENYSLGDIVIEGLGDKHAFVRTGVEIVQNTGYFVDGKFFYPGDALTNPNRAVEILALPVNAPWVKIEEVIQYVKEVNPRTAFSVHDGMLNNLGLAYIKKVLSEVLKTIGIDYVTLEIGKEEDL